jgi:hypothetical protein
MVLYALTSGCGRVGAQVQLFYPALWHVIVSTAFMYHLCNLEKKTLSLFLRREYRNKSPFVCSALGGGRWHLEVSVLSPNVLPSGQHL